MPADELIVATQPRADVWRRALSGLTPSLLGIIAVLLAIRMVGNSISSWVLTPADTTLANHALLFVLSYVALCTMTVPMLLIILATANLGPRHGWKRVVALATAVALSTAAGVMLRTAVSKAFGLWPTWFDFGGFPHSWPRYALLGGLLTLVGEFYRREVANTEAARKAELDRVAAEREMAEARLQVLQAQIEPHFLFNTLANVRRLYEQDEAAGQEMLDNLLRYLEIALPHMREAESTLGRDAALVESYLRIQQIRMGRRLEFSVDIPQPLRAHAVPPMMVLTLVENAIKHGLNASTSGGQVRVSASSADGKLAIRVADTGVGFGSGSGGGTGLANVRARLGAQFGAEARLALENNDLGGATATIVLPLAGETR